MVADYQGMKKRVLKSAAEVEELTKVNEGLKEELKRINDEKVSLRKGLSKELQVYKEQNAEMLNRQIAKYVKQKD